MGDCDHDGRSRLREGETKFLRSLFGVPTNKRQYVLAKGSRKELGGKRPARRPQKHEETPYQKKNKNKKREERRKISETELASAKGERISKNIETYHRSNG